ncbi:hypothetical protein TNCV_2355411 [Trichonephila clavipes]|nr:hypothetical protein TNCV_2355411 [Trichonephila clavipes]
MRESYLRRTIKLHRGLLTKNLIILNDGQVTRTTPDLSTPLLTSTPRFRESVGTSKDLTCSGFLHIGYWGGPRNFEPLSSDEKNSRAGIPLLHNMPSEGYLSLDRLSVHRHPLHNGSAVARDSNSWHASHEFVTMLTNEGYAAVPFETGIHFRRKTDFFPEEDTTMSYSGFEPEPTRLKAEGHNHHTGWATILLVIITIRTPMTLGKIKNFPPWNVDGTVKYYQVICETGVL